MEIKEIKIGMEEYPEQLRDIEDAPKVLYCIGNIELLKEEIIAVVGTRRASPYGKWVAHELAKNLSSAVMVSGLAEGIDTAAHVARLSEGSPTIAVLGTGIDIVFPRSNEELYRKIAETGLIISEYEPGVTGTKSTFVKKNRIISGLSKAVIVAEAGRNSGALLTANYALQQGREVFAVPGNINQPNSAGVNDLISDGAGVIADFSCISKTLGL